MTDTSSLELCSVNGFVKNLEIVHCFLASEIGSVKPFFSRVRLRNFLGGIMSLET